MRINSPQLASQLKKGLAGVYWVHGDETLIVQETCDLLRQHCREQGFTSREILHVEAGFDWHAAVAGANSMSLFADRQLLEIRWNSDKPAAKIVEIIADYAHNPNPDTIVLLITPKLDAKATRSATFTRLEQATTLVQVWPIDAEHLPDWVGQRLAAKGLRADREALEILCSRVEGNLLAAQQEIDKIALLASGDQLTASHILELVSDNARYDAFKLVDQALGGHSSTALRMLHSLRAEGLAPNNLLWVLGREVQLLASIREAAARIGSDSALTQAQVWKSREGLVRQALRRLSLVQLTSLLALCRDADHAVKGAGVQDPWDLLEAITLGLGGTPLPTWSDQVAK